MNKKKVKICRFVCFFVHYQSSTKDRGENFYSSCAGAYHWALCAMLFVDMTSLFFGFSLKDLSPSGQNEPYSTLNVYRKPKKKKKVSGS